MKTNLFLALVCVFVAGCANGFMDSLQFHYNQTGFDEISTFWNPELSWRNKYAICEGGALCQPLRPRFAGATTWLSFLTDGWHFMKFIYLNTMRIGILLLVWWAASLERKIKLLNLIALFLGLIALHAAGFHFVYSFIF